MWRQVDFNSCPPSFDGNLMSVHVSFAELMFTAFQGSETSKSCDFVVVGHFYVSWQLDSTQPI